MALPTCRLSIDWTPEGGQPESIDLDCSITEGYEKTAEVSEHAVEDGPSVSDNVVANNETFSFEAIVSNTPLTTPTFGMDGTTGDVQAQSITVGGQTVTARTFQFSQVFNRAVAVDLKIRDLIDSKQVVTVSTGVREIDNCLITRYRWERTAKTGNDLALTLEVSQARIATTRQVAVAPAQRSGQHSQNRGSQPAQPTTNQSAGFGFLASAGVIN